MLPLYAWALALMQAWAPVDRTPPWPELRTETAEARLERYTAIAEAAVDVAYDTANEPLFDAAHGGRARTAALLLSIAFFESRFYNAPTTRRGRDTARSDHGRSWCAAQILIGPGGVPGRRGYYVGLVPERWTGRELEADPRRCETVSYRFLRASITGCRRAPLEQRLGRYTGEGCTAGAVKAIHRMRRALDAPLP